MASEFHAYLKSNKMPPIDKIARALSSRGWVFDFSGDKSLVERKGNLGLTVDGRAMGVDVKIADAASPTWKELMDAAQTRGDGETLIKVLQNTDLRITFTADGDASTYARDVCRASALLALGAFENPEQGKLIYYGA